MLSLTVSGQPQATFSEMKHGTAEEWSPLHRAAVEFQQGLAERVMEHLTMLDRDYSGFAVDRLEHSLQTATRAHRDGRDEEYVVCALMHDIGDMLASYNHADLAATILKPFISEENHWMVEKHAIFQGYYFFHYIGQDRDMREKYRGHPGFERTAEFCEKYDQNSFEVGFDTMPLSAFEPMVQKVFAQPRFGR